MSLVTEQGVSDYYLTSTLFYLGRLKIVFETLTSLILGSLFHQYIELST